uniref:Uncharacterized protein n=1 Tax=Anopheles atroparvus TaxID=41427 RepID=A0AAG5DUS9_ANOAO
MVMDMDRVESRDQKISFGPKRSFDRKPKRSLPISCSHLLEADTGSELFLFLILGFLSLAAARFLQCGISCIGYFPLLFKG